MNFKALLLSFAACLVACTHAQTTSFLSATKAQRASFKADLLLQEKEIEAQLYSQFGEDVLTLCDNAQQGLASTLAFAAKLVAITAVAVPFMIDKDDRQMLDGSEVFTALKFAAGVGFASALLSVKEGKIEKQHELKAELKNIKASLREIAILDAAETNAVA